MKKLISYLKVLVLAGVMSTMTGCLSPSSVDAGEEGVMIKKPWILGHGGVVDEPITTGLVWTAWSTEVQRVNIQPFNIDEVFDDLVTSDNNPVDFTIHLTFQHIAGKTPILVEKFGKTTRVEHEDGSITATYGWYGAKVKGPLKNSVRAFTKSHKMFDMTTNGETTDALEVEVNKLVSEFLEKEGIPTILVKATVGKVMPPEAVRAETIATAVQVQAVKTAKKRVDRENARRAAEIAAAKADKAYMNEINMTNDQYLRMKELDNQKLAIEKGADINIVIGNAQPMFSVGK